MIRQEVSHLSLGVGWSRYCTVQYWYSYCTLQHSTGTGTVQVLYITVQWSQDSCYKDSMATVSDPVGGSSPLQESRRVGPRLDMVEYIVLTISFLGGAAAFLCVCSVASSMSCEGIVSIILYCSLLVVSVASSTFYRELPEKFLLADSEME